ncbi:hypothetical protein PUR59_30910 [Streptomyces sp. SP18ES09]|uniref:hypothetical protein n=1 Tax=Streptomyces sp. SP18ES09 TaxID=3002532 RepID=UPI002E79AF51|nr:hypothetical protein [Streptomyces sp. SP18ES09]MEE1819414.1 hypothetical protein [Streptomyces sp. SP18ES09]
MTKDQAGRIIGASFGLVFIQAGAGSLPAAIAVPLRVLALAAFLRVAVLGRRGRTAGAPASTAPAPAVPGAGTGFGRRYWYVVAAEVLGLVAGLLVIARVLHLPQAAVGWIALVVGVHFSGLAVAWRRPALHGLGAAIAACGGVGLALAALGAPAVAIRVAAGILPGVLLLASVWRPGRTDPAAPTAEVRSGTPA